MKKRKSEDSRALNAYKLALAKEEHELKKEKEILKKEQTEYFDAKVDFEQEVLTEKIKNRQEWEKIKKTL